MSPRSRKWLRIGFAGPGAVVVAIVAAAGMTLWLPSGAAGIDNLVLPMVLLPLIWAGLFFHACLDARLGRIALVAVGLFAVHGGLVAHKLLAGPPVASQTAAGQTAAGQNATGESHS